MSPRTRACQACGHRTRPYDAVECSKCGEPFLWRRTYGRKGYNLVTVYERVPGGPVQIMWWDREGRHRETMGNLDGVAVFDHERAEAAAKTLSEGIRRKQEKKQKTLRDLAGQPERHTVRDLFAQLHRDRAHEWKPKHLRGQRRFRRFWEKALGRDTDISEVNAGVVSRIVAKEASVLGWKLKTQNHYMNAVVATWDYAITFLTWLPADKHLKAVRRHRIAVDNEEISYTKEETQALLPTTSGVDLRCAVCADLSFIGSRRLTAIRTLNISAYRTETRLLEGGGHDLGVVRFPATTDKAGKKGEVYLYGGAKKRIERLIATPACQSSGLLFPKLDLDSSTPPAEPVTEKFLRRWLREAEELANVAQVEGRSYHGFNRAFAGAHNNILAASGQAGKRRDTMAEIYEGARPDDKAELSIYLDRMLKGA